MTDSCPNPAGKVALVTGASRGIGYGVAEALVARGDRVCITGRNEDALKEAVEQLGADRVIGVAGKAHDEAHQAAAVERTMEAFGRVDYLVNNAGTNPVFGPLADLDLGVARKVFETNVVSALGFAQQTWHAWQKEQRRRDRQHRLRRRAWRPRPSSAPTASARPRWSTSTVQLAARVRAGACGSTRSPPRW